MSWKNFEVVEIGLNELEAKIREDGEKEIKKIDSEREREMDAIKKEALQKAKEYSSKILREGEAEMEMTRKRIISDANTKVRELISVERNRLVDRVFDEAKNRILKLSDNEKREILTGLVEEGMKSVKDPIILIDEKYKNLLSEAEPANLNDFGVVLMSRDKRLRMDNTLESRLQHLKIKLKPQVASALFT